MDSESAHSMSPWHSIKPYPCVDKKIEQIINKIYKILGSYLSSVDRFSDYYGYMAYYNEGW